MVAGVDKYFQIAPCMRDEDPRADRHAGAFYQIDIEMSFPTTDKLFAAAENPGTSGVRGGDVPWGQRTLSGQAGAPCPALVDGPTPTSLWRLVDLGGWRQHGGGRAHLWYSRRSFYRHPEWH